MQLDIFGEAPAARIATPHCGHAGAVFVRAVGDAQ